MGSIYVISGLSSVLGVMLAGVCWGVGTLAVGDALPGRLDLLVVMLTTGGIIGCAVGALASRLARRPKVPASPKTRRKASASKAPTTRKRQRHPLDPRPCLARVNAALVLEGVSSAFAAILGNSKKAIAGTLIASWIEPDDWPAVANAFSESQKTGQIQRALCRIQSAGSVRSVRLDIWPNAARRAGKRGFICRILDLAPIALPQQRELDTARDDLTQMTRSWHKADHDLARLKLSYRELYQYAPVMYFSTDREGRLVTFNDTLIQTLGYERQELQGKQYTHLLAPATLKSYVTIAESMPSQGAEVETQWRKKDGTVIDVWLHSVPVHDENRQFVRYRSAALDLTEKNRLAHELRARGNELERTNQRLRTINAELEAFTHVVSHDLKEPLRTLQAYSHLLAEEHAAELGADGFQYINHLVRASRRLGELIDELLNLSQAGRITRHPRAFNFIEIVATVRQDLVDLTQRRDANLVTEGALPDVVGDSVRITQLVTNLVANGLKYNRNEKPQVVIGGMPCAHDPRRVTVYIRDNGIGIDPAFHKQIFGIFRRLHKSEEYEGTGAGLAICKKIVEGHGGRIWVESNPGRGATFYFTLPRPPRLLAPPPNGARAENPGSAIQEPAGQSKQRRTALKLDNSHGVHDQRRIVLVEDQADVAMIIQKLGQRDGLEITWYATAEEAWVSLQHQKADLLLLDLNLPGMNGVDLCRRLRQVPNLQEMSIAMFTPDQDAESLQVLRSAGANFFLTKDLLCQPTDWQRKIRELLGQIGQPAAH